MKKILKKVGLSLLIAQTACNKPPTCGSSVKSGANGVTCNVSYKMQLNARIEGIKIDDVGIPASEKIRHLNELNAMPIAFLDIMRNRITINMMPGGITNHPAYSSLKGVQPRGWPAGSTWDTVAGVGSHADLGLGDSHKDNDTGSLAIHEATHSVDSQLGIIRTQEFLSYYNKEKNSPYPGDLNGGYRTQHPEEYLAMAVDDYFCNQQTRSTLLKRYPNAHAMVENVFLKQINASNKRTQLPSEPPIPDPRGETPVKPDKPVEVPIQEPMPEPVMPDPPAVDETEEPEDEPVINDEDESDEGNSEDANPEPRPDPIHKPKPKSKKTMSTCS